MAAVSGMVPSIEERIVCKVLSFEAMEMKKWRSPLDVLPLPFWTWPTVVTVARSTVGPLLGLWGTEWSLTLTKSFLLPKIGVRVALVTYDFWILMTFCDYILSILHFWLDSFISLPCVSWMPLGHTAVIRLGVRGMWRLVSEPSLITSSRPLKITKSWNAKLRSEGMNWYELILHYLHESRDWNMYIYILYT